RIVRRYAARRRKRNAPSAPTWCERPTTRAEAGEHHHHSYALLKAGCIGGQHKNGPLRAVAENTNARPHINGMRQAVMPRRHEDNSLARVVFGLVDCRLNHAAVVGRAISMNVELWSAEIDRLLIVQA